MRCDKIYKLSERKGVLEEKTFEKEKLLKILKIFQKSSKKRLTFPRDLWYHIQAVAKKGTASRAEAR